MKPSHPRLVAALLVIALCIAVRFTGKPSPSTPAGESISSSSVRARVSAPDIAREQETAEKTARRRIEEDWAGLLQWLRSDPRPDPEEVRERLLALRLEWTAMDPQVRAAMIDLLLKSGDDAVTGLDFKVGNHGQLAGWPTLRTFLLDILATADPEMAPAIARRLLDSTDSADEFVTGLRSLTRENAGRAENSELLERFGKLLARTDWQQTRAFAEALDLARFVGTPEAAKQLAGWSGNSALKTMAMDEFAAEHPAAMLQVLESGPDLDGLQRANLMARMDPADDTQLAAVDAYLRSPDLSAGNAATFLKIYPLRSATTGFRLYGKTPAPYSFDRIAASDRRAAGQVAAWLADPSLEKFKPDLTALQQRLANWVEQAK